MKRSLAEEEMGQAAWKGTVTTGVCGEVQGSCSLQRFLQLNVPGALRSIQLQ